MRTEQEIQRRIKWLEEAAPHAWTGRMQREMRILASELRWVLQDPEEGS